MVESEDEFAELCSKLLKRVKKSKPLEGQNVSTASTAGKSKLKRAKPSGTKNKANNGAIKEAEQNKAGGDPEKPSAENGTERIFAVPMPQSIGHMENDVNGKESQEETSRLPDQPSVKDRVLERMQQFKRTSPIRMKLNSVKVKEERIETFEVNSDVHTDGDLAMALQMDLKEQQPVSLEDEGLFFCQLCQKDLTSMSSALREQHVNRCLDQGESVQNNPAVPMVPSCPLCGKPFTTEKSRSSHLKRCAAKLEVPAQTLLHAVQRQAAETVTEIPARVAKVKRKGAPKQKEPSKKRKVAQTGAEIEDLMVAMALSRSMQEENTTPNNLSEQPTREIAPPEKKSRKKKNKPVKPTPLLLVQAPEEAVQKLQKRMSMLLSEEPVDNNLIVLPASHFWNIEKEERETWSLRAGKKCVLWDISNMMETRDRIGYYTTELNPPITPWKPITKKVLSSQPRTVVSFSSTLSASQMHKEKNVCPVTPCKDQTPPSDSQKDRQALLDLAELAGEGMTLTQWNCVPGYDHNQTGRESPIDIASSGFIPSDRDEPRRVSQVSKPSKSADLSLTADFMGMVNNPHLSDVQLQTDCGEVLNVHMFVLYARCPLLVEAVHTEGFLVDEASSGRVRRLLLNDVSAEAALCFLRFLYAAKTDFPSHCLPHVCELARRFGVKSLIDTCEYLVSEPDRIEVVASAEEEEDNDDDGGERADNFQQLLKSMWVDEDHDLFTKQEEEPVNDECVGEVDLEEIYEFAFTQRRMPETLGTECRSSSEPNGGSEAKSPVACFPSPIRLAAGEREEFMDTTNQQSAEWHKPTHELSISPFKPPFSKINVTGSSLGKSHDCPQPNSFKSPPTAHPVSSAQPGTHPFSYVSPVKSPKELPLSSPTLPKSHPKFVHYVSPMKSPVVSLLCSPVQSRIQQTPDHCISPIKSPVVSVSSSPARSRGQPTPDFSVSPVKSSPVCSPAWSSPKCTVMPVKSTASQSLSLPRSQPLPGHSVLPVKPPSGKSPARQLFPNEQSKPSESSSDVLNEYSVSAVDTISLVSPERDDEPEPDLFSQHSPQTFEDSYDRMFAETCGEYVEPSGICEPNSHIIASSPQRGQPILTSSPSASQKSSLPELGSSPNILPTHPFLEHAPHSVTENRKTPTISLSPSKFGPAIQNFTSGPSSSTVLPQRQDVILILSSDEEVEDSPQAGEVNVQSNKLDFFKTIKESPASFNCLDNSAEISWLVPATPMAHVTATGVSQLQSSRIPRSPEMPKSRTHGSSQDSFVSPTQANLSPIGSSNTTKTSFFMKQPLHSNPPEKHTELCFSTGENSSCVPSVTASSVCISNTFVKQPLYSNTPEKGTDICYSAGSNVSCVPTSSLSSIASSNVFVKQPLFPNTPEKHMEACTSTGSKISCGPSSPQSPIASSNVFVKQPLFPNTPEKQIEACPSTGSKISCVSSSPQSPIASSNVFVKQPLFPNTPEKQMEACASTGSKTSCVPSSTPSSIASSNVFEVVDSDEEGPVAEPQANASVGSFQIDYDEPPIPVEDDLWLCEEETPTRPSYSPECNTSVQHIDRTPTKAPEDSFGTSALQKKDRESGNKEDSPRTPASQSSRLSCLNSKLWDDWEDEDPELPVLSLSQRLNQVPNMQKHLKTPVSIVRRRELPPKVPITPLPEYSDMDTPVLKKELSKFGVRALPKKQMVLKLKEIFSYTHQVMSSDSEDDVPSLQPNRRNPTTTVQSPMKQKRPAVTKTTGSSLPQPAKKKLASVCAAQEPESGDDQPLTASQESTTSSVAASDLSSISHSSGTNEFEMAFADEDDDELVSASQAASKEELKVEAVRRFIEERPDLHKRILLYQPLDLAALHTELKQSGIRIAAGKLLDFLDAHCVTFTTATARKEKKSRGRRKAAKRH